MGFAVLRREANEGGYFGPIVKDVVEKYLDCGNPRSGFALMIRCRLMRTDRNGRPDPLSALLHPHLHFLVTEGGSGSLSSFSLREWMFRSPPCFGRPLFVYFAEIDSAERQGVYSRRGQTGRFIDRSGNSWRTGKSKFLSIGQAEPQAAMEAPLRHAQAEGLCDRRSGRSGPGRYRPSAVPRWRYPLPVQRPRRDLPLGHKPGVPEGDEHHGHDVPGIYGKEVPLPGPGDPSRRRIGV